MPDSDTLSRKLISLLIAWASVTWGALSAWATYVHIMPPDLLSGSVRDGRLILYYIHVGLVALAALAGPLYVAAARMGWRLPDRMSRALMNERSLWGLLFGFGAARVFLSLAPLNRFVPLAGFSMAACVALAVVWFFHREETPTRHLIAVIVWGALLYAAADVSATLDGLAAGALIGLALLPLLALIPAVSGRMTSAIRQLAAILAGWLVAIIGLVVIFQIGWWLTRLAAQPVFTLTVWPALLAGGLLALRFERREVESGQEPDRAWWWLALIAGGYVILALIWLPHWQGYVTPDGYAYLEIARKYASGQFVVRGTWSPLISWLVAGPVALGADPEMAARWLAIASGAACTLLIYPLAGNLGLNRTFRLAAAGAMALLALRHGFWPLGPDLLSAAILLGYFTLVSGRWPEDHPAQAGMLAGLLGGLAYFARAFNLPFITAHLILSGGLAVWQGRRRKPALTFSLIALAVMLLVAAPWIGLLAARYDRFVISTATIYHQSRFGPGNTSFQQLCRLTLCPEPNDILFTWEDPDLSVLLPYEWSMFDSVAAFGLKIWHLSDSMAAWWRNTLVANVGLLPLLAWPGAALLSLLRWPRREVRGRLIWLALSAVLYVGGYLFGLSNSEFRYYYGILPLLMVGVLIFAQGVADHLRGERSGRYLLLMAVFVPLASSVLRPSRHTPAPPWFGPAPMACVRSDSLAMAGDLDGPMAGAAPDNQIHILSYYSQQRSIGAFPEKADLDEMDRLAHSLGIQTIVTSNRDLARQLEADYGYRIVAQHDLCGRAYWIVRPVP